LFAVGGNYKAAKLSGIDVDRVLLTVYILAAFAAAISGIIYTSRMTVGQPSAGDGYEMFAIAAAVIGGANLNGGSGNVFGTVIGVLILGVLSNFLNLTSISPFVRDAIRGILILGAVYYNWRQSNK
jgi:ribose transport system permease protein